MPRRSHQEQVVDVIFDDIVNGHDNAAADLHALGLPASWASYAGDGFWAPHSVYHDPLYPEYTSRLTDANLARFLLTHPMALLKVGQQAADDALVLRVDYLGSYAPSAGQPEAAIENRVTVLESIVQAIPDWPRPALAAPAVGRDGRGGRCGPCGDGTGRAGSATAPTRSCCWSDARSPASCPAAYFAGVETTRHMLGTNLATALAFILSATLTGSMVRRSIADEGSRDAGESRAGPDEGAESGSRWAARHGRSPSPVLDR